ncbi:MAG: hypothetical protein ACFFG0_42160 [Candidatus Thorarchaeota archaeon]
MTFEALNKFPKLETDIHSFYNELNKISYYNSFFRIKEELIDKEIINISKQNKKTMICLTLKGVMLQNMLNSIEKFIEDSIIEM